MSSQVRIIHLQLTSKRNTRRARDRNLNEDQSLLRRLLGRLIAHLTVNVLEVKPLNIKEMKVLRTSTL